MELWSDLQLNIDRLFINIDIKPSLVHGDLWSGNAGETTDEPGRSQWAFPEIFHSPLLRISFLEYTDPLGFSSHIFKILLDFHVIF